MPTGTRRLSPVRRLTHIRVWPSWAGRVGRISYPWRSTDAGAHEVTVARGGRVAGTIDLGGDGEAQVDGMAGRVNFANNDSVTVGPAGRIPGIDGVSVESRSGAPAVTIVMAADESPGDAAASARPRAILP